MGYKWGTKFDEIEGLQISDPIAVKIDLPYYEAVNENENVEIYGTKSSSVTYFFEDDRLVSVVVTVPSQESFETVKEYCFNLYGIRRNRSKSKSDEGYFWLGEKTQIELSHSSQQKPPTYGHLIVRASDKNSKSKINSQIDKFSHILGGMEFDIQYNKNYFCGFGRYLDFIEKYENYNAYVCKLFDLADEETSSVFAEINKTGVVNPGYYYFSIFKENSDNQDESSYETLSEESEIGLFPSLGKCNELAQFALSHNIPIRNCRSWKSHTDYMDKLLEPFSKQGLE